MVYDLCTSVSFHIFLEWGSMYKVQCGQPLPSHHFPEGVMYMPVGQFERVHDPDAPRRVRQHTDHSGVSVHHTKPCNRKFLSKYTAIMYTQCQCIDCTEVTI